MRYDSVIFDLDGTLFDTSEGMFNCVIHALGLLKVEVPTMSELEKFIGPALNESFKKICSLDDSSAEFASAAFRERYLTQGIYEVSTYPYVENLLTCLKNKGVKMSIATLKNQDSAEKLLDHLGFAPYFDSICGALCDWGDDKTEIIRRSIRSLEPENISKVVLVGDSMFDAMGAVANGVDFIAVLHGFGFRDRKSVDYDTVLIAENMNEVMDFLCEEPVVIECS